MGRPFYYVVVSVTRAPDPPKGVRVRSASGALQGNLLLATMLPRMKFRACGTQVESLILPEISRRSDSDLVSAIL